MTNKKYFKYYFVGGIIILLIIIGMLLINCTNIRFLIETNLANDYLNKKYPETTHYVSSHQYFDLNQNNTFINFHNEGEVDNNNIYSVLVKNFNVIGDNYQSSKQWSNDLLKQINIYNYLNLNKYYLNSFSVIGVNNNLYLNMNEKYNSLNDFINNNSEKEIIFDFHFVTCKTNNTIIKNNINNFLNNFNLNNYSCDLLIYTISEDNFNNHLSNNNWEINEEEINFINQYKWRNKKLL